MDKVIIEKDRSSILGYYVRIDYSCVAYTFTLWGAKRVARRYLKPAISWDVE